MDSIRWRDILGLSESAQKDVLCRLVEENVVRKLDSHHVQLLDEYLPKMIKSTVEYEVDVVIDKIVEVLAIEGEVLEDEDYERGEGDDH